MVGQGVLLECLRDPGVERHPHRRPQAIRLEAVEFPESAKDPRARSHRLSGLHRHRNQLTGLDACYFCLGAGSSGMSEADYTRITYGITVAAIQRPPESQPESILHIHLRRR